MIGLPLQTKVKGVGRQQQVAIIIFIRPISPVFFHRMDSSGSHSPDGETVTLHNLMCHGENLFIQVETTAPPPKRRSRRKR